MSNPASTPAAAAPAPRASVTPAIEYFELDREMTLRRMVVRPANPKGVVLLLHGFPETIYAWEKIASDLSGDYEVHAFDWPGYGLSTRPADFGYAPRDYARVLRTYIEKAGIDRSKLTIYGTDVGGLPALIAALEEPGIARAIIVGDFAPFDRPQYMQERLRAMKAPETNEQMRAAFNAGRDEILENVMRRGLKPEEQFEISAAFKADMAQGWTRGAVTAADALARYYAHFTRDQNHLEANIERLKTPVQVVWGAKDVLIDKEMGIEFSRRARAGFTLLPGVGHFPHLQAPNHTIAGIRATFA